MFILCFLSLLDLFLRNVFLSFHLTITPCWISLFTKGAWFASINLLFDGAIVFTTDRKVSLKYFKLLSLNKFEFISLFNTWSLICRCGNLVILVFILQKMSLVLLGWLCGSGRVQFQMSKSFGRFWTYLFGSNQLRRDYWGFCSMRVILRSS